MAQVWTAKQTNFVQRYANAVQGLLNIVDQLTLLNAEFSNDAYGTGGANAITDVIVQGVLPASTAALFNSGEASVVTVLTSVASVRSALENMRS
jgi:hypothetical protein